MCNNALGILSQDFQKSIDLEFARLLKAAKDDRERCILLLLAGSVFITIIAVLIILSSIKSNC